MEFNHADLFEGIADAVPDRMAMVCEPDRLTYAQLDAHANRLAHHLLDIGVEPGRHVGMQLYNGMEYVAALLAALKIRAVPINVNYRYVEDELLYLYRDSDIVALLFDTEFAGRVAATAPEAPLLRHLIEVGGHALPDAQPYDEAIKDRPETRGFGERSGDDRYIIYTGGTTGMPKGVVWRTEDMFFAFPNPVVPEPAKPEDVPEQARKFGQIIMMPVAPLMHGAAQMGTWAGMRIGCTLVYVRKFDAAGVLRTIETEKVNSVSLVGDAMARPIADDLERNSYDLSSLITFVSTGAILSGVVRDRIRKCLPNVDIQDRFGSTESGSTAQGASGASAEGGLRFAEVAPNLAVLDADLRPVPPGPDDVGQVALSGHVALSYYKDPQKTSRTFVEIDGVRWMLTGDLATVGEDGTVTFLGRGSVCINTGGEKVYPEEVEATLKRHPGVLDVTVTGIPDETYGSRVGAVIELSPDVTVTEDDLDRHCRAHLAGYKVPRAYAFVERIQRSPAGKADYRWARARFTAAAEG